MSAGGVFRHREEEVEEEEMPSPPPRQMAAPPLSSQEGWPPPPSSPSSTTLAKHAWWRSGAHSGTIRGEIDRMREAAAGLVHTPRNETIARIVHAAEAAAVPGAHAGAAAAASAAGGGEESDAGAPVLHPHATRLANIKAAAAKDKETLLLRIEELCGTVRAVEGRLRARDETLERYQRVLGPLHEFSARQVQMREEIVGLRDSVRMWQDKEAAARAQAKSLQKTMEAMRRRSTITTNNNSSSGGAGGDSDDDSAESRLADLQERLAFAHLQRSDAEAELQRVEDLAAAQQKHIEATVGPAEEQSEAVRGGASAAPTHHAWRLRGKLADLQLVVKQRTALIDSLSSAIRELEAVAQSSSAAQIGAANRRCPGCGRPQWESPFCPATGHRHLGFGSPHKAPTVTRTDADGPKGTGPPATPAVSVEAALESGEWKKLVEVGSFKVKFKHVATGRCVTDLAAELLKQQQQQEEATQHKDVRRTELSAAVNPSANGRAGDAAAAAAERPGGAGAAVATARPSLHKEVERLLEQLRRKNDENAKLRGLLAALSASGRVGATDTAHSASPRELEGQQGAPQLVTAPQSDVAAAKGRTPARDPQLLVALGTEHDSTDGNWHLRAEKAALNARCAELVLLLAARDDELRELRARADAARFSDGAADGGGGGGDEKATTTSALHAKVDALRDALQCERRRSRALEEEIHRLSARPPPPSSSVR